MAEKAGALTQSPRGKALSSSAKASAPRQVPVSPQDAQGDAEVRQSPTQVHAQSAAQRHDASFGDPAYAAFHHRKEAQSITAAPWEERPGTPHDIGTTTPKRELASVPTEATSSRSEPVLEQLLKDRCLQLGEAAPPQRKRNASLPALEGVGDRRG